MTDAISLTPPPDPTHADASGVVRLMDYNRFRDFFVVRRPYRCRRGRRQHVHLPSWVAAVRRDGFSTK